MPVRNGLKSSLRITAQSISEIQPMVRAKNLESSRQTALQSTGPKIAAGLRLG
jgi:hypothetical protein